MKHLSSLASVWLAFVLVAIAATASAAPVTRQVKVSGPTIVVFVPPEVRQQRDEGSVEGIAHVQFAMQDTSKCLGSKKVRFEFEFADTIVLQDGGQSARLRVRTLGQGFGAILVEPSRQAKVVFTEFGPSTLQYLLPHAVAEYWHVEACKADG